MAAAVVERPIASSAYSFVRFTGGAIAPFVAGKLGEHVSAGAPMYLGAGMVALSVVALLLSRHHLRPPAVETEAPATAAAVPAGAVLVAIDATPAARLVVETAERVTRSRGTAAHVVHVRETRAVGEDTADLEDTAAARTLVGAAVGRLTRAGVPATGEVLHVTGRHEDAAGAVLALADRIRPAAVVVGRPGRHGGELGARSLATVLTERAPCDVVVVAGAGRPEPVAV